MRFGRLTVISEDPDDTKHRSMWICRCDCGNVVSVSSGHLRYGDTKSCGCYKSEVSSKRKKTHGFSDKELLYNIWMDVKQRCFCKTCKAFPHYGGRGIAVCDEWKNDYMSFRNWSLSNGYSEGLTIDRIDNDGWYAPNNCRWVDMKVQNSNKRNNRILTLNGKSQTLQQWSEQLGINAPTIHMRIFKYGWSVERALTTPTKRTHDAE